jgi:hypothetical protein
MTQWFESLVQLRLANDTKGSGLLISTTEVLTAAHVVAPNGPSLPIDDIEVDLRFRSHLAPVRSIKLLDGWEASRTTGSDMALVCIDPQAGLGISPAFGVPATGQSAMLEAHGFIAQDDSRRTLVGSVRFQPPSPADPFLFTDDFSPIPGMSGGPLLTGANGSVQVAGILTQLSTNDFIGLAVLASVLATLRGS